MTANESDFRVVLVTLLSLAALGIAACEQGDHLAASATSYDSANVSSVYWNQREIERAPRMNLNDAIEFKLGFLSSPDSPAIEITDAMVLGDSSVALLAWVPERGHSLAFLNLDDLSARWVLPEELPNFNFYVPWNDGVVVFGPDSHIEEERDPNVAILVSPDGTWSTLATLATKWHYPFGILSDESLLIFDGGRYVKRGNGGVWLSSAFRITGWRDDIRDGEPHESPPILTVEWPFYSPSLNVVWSQSPKQTSAVGKDRMWLALTDRPEMYAVSAAGRPLLRVHWYAGDRTIPKSAVDAWRANKLGRLELEAHRDSM